MKTSPKGYLPVAMSTVPNFCVFFFAVPHRLTLFVDSSYLPKLNLDNCILVKYWQPKQMNYNSLGDGKPIGYFATS